MSRSLPFRVAVGAIGVAIAAWGAWTLLTNSRVDQLVNTVLWLGGGIAAHDALIAPLTLVLAWLLVRRMPEWLRGSAAAGFVVLGTVTVVAIPVLGAWGRRADNATLLPRDYWVGWLIVAAVVAAGVMVVALVTRQRGSEHGGPET